MDKILVGVFIKFGAFCTIPSGEGKGAVSFLGEYLHIESSSEADSVEQGLQPAPDGSGPACCPTLCRLYTKGGSYFFK